MCILASSHQLERYNISSGGVHDRDKDNVSLPGPHNCIGKQPVGYRINLEGPVTCEYVGPFVKVKIVGMLGFVLLSI